MRVVFTKKHPFVLVLFRVATRVSKLKQKRDEGNAVSSQTLDTLTQFVELRISKRNVESAEHQAELLRGDASGVPGVVLAPHLGNILVAKRHLFSKETRRRPRVHRRHTPELLRTPLGCFHRFDARGHLFLGQSDRLSHSTFGSRQHLRRLAFHRDLCPPL